MARPFIAEGGFYPGWVRGGRRWVIQRVFTTVRGIIGETDTLSRPTVSYESLIWVPRRGWLAALQPFESGADASRALEELQRIPLVCSECEWCGCSPRIDADRGAGPSRWRVRCPSCYSLVGPDIDFLDPKVIIQRWKERARPRLDPPGAARLIESIAPITNLEEWFERFQPMENEVVYAGQQLWPNFAAFIHDARQPHSS